MIYCINGLGADERVFKYLDLGNQDMKYIKWETPFQREKLEDYCKRLIKQIDVSKEIILIGVSFGGIVAQEISRLLPVKKTIIISSIKSAKELGWQLYWVRFLKLYKPVPSRFLKWSNALTGNYYFGVTSKAESQLLHQIIKDTDRFFMKWAIGEIMNWSGNTSHSNLVHIHGDKDRIFPVKPIKNYIRIKGGGHFMIVNRADEISFIIKSAIT